MYLSYCTVTGSGIYFCSISLLNERCFESWALDPQVLGLCSNDSMQYKIKFVDIIKSIDNCLVLGKCCFALIHLSNNLFQNKVKVGCYEFKTHACISYQRNLKSY